MVKEFKSFWVIGGQSNPRVLRNCIWLVEGVGRGIYSNLLNLMSFTSAIVEVAKLYQKEHEHIRVYASKFIDLHRFFKDTLTET